MLPITYFTTVLADATCLNELACCQLKCESASLLMYAEWLSTEPVTCTLVYSCDEVALRIEQLDAKYL